MKKYAVQFTSELRRNTHGGLFVALEGIDGSGKSVQGERLRNYFLQKKKKTLFTQFPRKDQGIISREILAGKSAIPKAAFQYLFSADYVVLVDEIITPALKQDELVISDRFHCWSSVAYGMFDVNGTYNRETVQSLMVANGLLSVHQQFFVPDITFLLDVSIKTALQRLAEKKEKDMYEKKTALHKISAGYQWLVKEFPEEFVIINAENDLEQVTQDIISVVEKRL